MKRLRGSDAEGGAVRAGQSPSWQLHLGTDLNLSWEAFNQDNHEHALINILVWSIMQSDRREAKIEPRAGPLRTSEVTIH